MSENQSKSAAGPLLSASSAFRFVFVLGIVNLFGDMTYEGASSINGQYLGLLGAVPVAIGVTAGVGEFLGYALRFVFGYIADRTGKYWLLTFIGYGINLLAVPALALVGSWQVAAVLVVAERVGRAIRKPTVEAMLSYTTHTLGRGWVYAFNNALDQTGAVLGPLLMALVLMLRGGKTTNIETYRIGFATLLVSALLALATIAVARFFFPDPSRLEAGPTTRLKRFTPSYWYFMLGGACVAAGLVSFELIAYHFNTTGSVLADWIPILFAIAMGVDGAAGLIFGRLFDRIGMPTVYIAFLLSALYPPLIFFGNFPVAAAGMVLWGIGFGAQDTLLKALIAGILPEGKRNLAFGLFYTGYGLGWLVGSVATGVLYGQSLTALVAFSIAAQLVSLPAFAIGQRMESVRTRSKHE
jgi:MFS family permease